MVDTVAVVLLLIFYSLILVVGVIAARKFDAGGGSPTELAFVAGRRLGPFVGIFTMTATLVGGGFLNGTAESVAGSGLAWTLAPFGIFLGLVLGGLIYAKPMREKCYLTLLDPLQETYGSVVTVLVYLATLCGDVFWTSSILYALGTSISVMTGLSITLAVIGTAVVSTSYTMIGQMVSVAFTDIFELGFIIIGLGVSLPFILTNEKTGNLTENPDRWLGSLEQSDVVSWVDLFITMTFGTIPWQSYFQRVLSVKTVRHAQILSVAAGFGALIFAVPPFLIGIVGSSADWNNTSRGISPLETNDTSLILPIVMKEFTPSAISLLGLSSICAAVMSSTDSSILGSSSMFTHNIFKSIFFRKASDRVMLWVQRFAIFLIGAVSTVIALYVQTVYGLFILAADVVFVIVLPQLTCAIFLKFVNGYGAVLGYIVGLVLRFGAGENYLNLQPFIPYPFYIAESNTQLFPFRVVAFVSSTLTILVVSFLTNYFFKEEHFSQSIFFGKKSRDKARSAGKKYITSSTRL